MKKVALGWQLTFSRGQKIKGGKSKLVNYELDIKFYYVSSYSEEHSTATSPTDPTFFGAKLYVELKFQDLNIKL